MAQDLKLQEAMQLAMRLTTKTNM